MAYSDFTLLKFTNQFPLPIQETPNLFADVKGVEPSDRLLESLSETSELALAINTEKARSEGIIFPILLELRRKANYSISLFSGTDFNVDASIGLNGYCDFIISLSSKQFLINAPVIIVVEAKNENIKAGLGQCMATMLAAQIFNAQKENDIPIIYGAVTTGDTWKFIKLQRNSIIIDLTNYYLTQLNQILGILSQPFKNT